MCAVNWKSAQGKTLPSTQRVQTGRDLPTSWKSLAFAEELHFLQAFSSVRFNLFFLLLLTEERWFHSVRFLVYLSSPLKSHSLCYEAEQTHLSLSLGQPTPHTHTHTTHHTPHTTHTHTGIRHKGTPVTDSYTISLFLLHSFMGESHKTSSSYFTPKLTKINGNNSNNNNYIRNGNSKYFT